MMTPEGLRTLLEAIEEGEHFVHVGDEVYRLLDQLELQFNDDRTVTFNGYRRGVHVTTQEMRNPLSPGDAAAFYPIFAAVKVNLQALPSEPVPQPPDPVRTLVSRIRGEKPTPKPAKRANTPKEDL